MVEWAQVIIGGGTMGTTAAWALGKRGIKTVVFEQFQHIHTKGSHGGHTRMIRHAYSEGAHYVPLVLRADQLWTELEDETGKSILHRTGTVELAVPGLVGFPQAARASADEHGLPYEWLDGAEVRPRSAAGGRRGKLLMTGKGCTRAGPDSLRLSPVFGPWPKSLTAREPRSVSTSW